MISRHLLSPVIFLLSLSSFFSMSHPLFTSCSQYINPHASASPLHPFPLYLLYSFDISTVCSVLFHEPSPSKRKKKNTLLYLCPQQLGQGVGFIEHSDQRNKSRACWTVIMTIIPQNDKRYATMVVKFNKWWQAIAWFLRFANILFDVRSKFP